MDRKIISSLVSILILLSLLMFTISNTSAVRFPFAYSTVTGINSVASLTHNVTLPTIGEAGNGDFYLICIDLNGNPGTITNPINWSVVQKGVNTMVLLCIFKLFTQDTSPVVITTSNLVQDAYVSVLIKGASDVYFPTSSPLSGNSASVNIPSIEISPSSNSYVIEAFAGGNNAFCDETSLSSGYSTIAIQQENGAASTTIALGYKITTAGKENPGIATFNISCLWSAMTFAFTNQQIQSFLTSETILLILIMIALVFIGFKIPLFWIFSSLSGFFAAFFVFRDINSAVASIMIIIASLMILFMFMVKALVGKIGLD